MSHTAKLLLLATLILTALLILSMPAGLLIRPVAAQVEEVPVDNLSITQDTRLKPGVYKIRDGDENGVIHIDADNVTVDGSGATLDGNEAGGGKSPGYGVRLNGHNGVKLRNFKITGYKYGMLIENAIAVLIENSNVSGNYKDTTSCFLGIRDGAIYGGGILFNNVSRSTVQNNALVNQSTGLEMIHSTLNRVLNNSTSIGPEGNESGQNSCWGIRLQGSDWNLLRGNTADYVDRKRYPCSCGTPEECEENHLKSGDSAGILLVSSDHNYVISNSFTHGGDGFFIGNGCEVSSDHNYIYGNDGSYSPGNAFECTYSDGNVFENNVASNSNYGFWLGHSYNTRVTRNEIDTERGAGIEIDSGHDNELDHNVIVRAAGYGIRLRSGAEEDSCKTPDCGMVCPFTESGDCPRCPGTNCISADYRIHHNSILLNSNGLVIENTARASVERNLIKNNADRNVWITAFSADIRLSHNDLTCETGKCLAAVYNCLPDGQPDVFAQNNWWGTADAQVIGNIIRDKTDDPNRGAVSYEPYAPEPIPISSGGSGPRLEQWTATTPLPKASAAPLSDRGQQLLIYNNRVYVFGGKTTGNAALRDVYFSAIRPDGGLGNWTATTQLPGPFNDHAVVRAGSYFYLLTGAGSTAVYYAAVNADGSIGNWTQTAPLTPSRQSFAAAAYGKYIYVSGGYTSNGTQSSVSYSSVGANGALNPWASTTALPEAVRGHTMTVYDGQLYVFAPSGKIYFAPIYTDGRVGTWQRAAAPLPGGLSGYATFQHDGYLYLLGGSPSPAPAYYLPVADNLLLLRQSWQPTASLPLPLTALRAGAHNEPVGNDYVYAAGGYDGTSYRNAVYYAPLELPAGCQMETPGFCFTGETLIAPLKGGTGAASSANLYPGFNTITVAGVGQNSAGSYSDAFYIFADRNGAPIAPTHPTETFNRVLSINGQHAELFIPGQRIPGYRHDHRYTFKIKAPTGPLTFGVSDNAPSANTGRYFIALCGGIDPAPDHGCLFGRDDP